MNSLSGAAPSNRYRYTRGWTLANGDHQYRPRWPAVAASRPDLRQLPQLFLPSGLARSHGADYCVHTLRDSRFPAELRRTDYRSSSRIPSISIACVGFVTGGGGG